MNELNEFSQRTINISQQIDCNDCIHINMTEEKQSDTHCNHMCEKYNRRVKHNAVTKIHDGWLHPCKECMDDNYKNYKESSMINLNRDLLAKVEQALNIHFRDWQIKYILQEPDILDMRITGRATGKTLAYIVKALLESEETLDLSNTQTLICVSDWYCCTNRMPMTVEHYQLWFLREMKDIYETLNDAGIKTRKVIFDYREKKKDTEWQGAHIQRPPFRM